MSANINHRVEIDKIFDAAKFALKNKSAFAYDLPAGFTAEEALSRSDDAVIAGFKSDRKSDANANVTTSADAVKEVFENGEGDSQENHEAVDDIFDEAQEKSDAYIERSRENAHKLLDRLSAGGQSAFVKILKAWAPTVLSLIVSLLSVIKAAVDWLVQTIKDALGWIGDRASELFNTIKGWFS